ncbi:MAG: cytochrome ubiquinol oxidase subunit I [Acidiferrobacterales bacterium]
MEEAVLLSRWQFGLTAMYHFLFVPLTIGLALLLAIMESVYVMTGRPIWREMTKFWGLLFGINFAMGVATGITMEFQFGTNWAYFSHFVGDIFGVPLAIEGLMAFFLEATLVGLFFFGWERLRPVQHLSVTWLMALGTNLSALWILVANGWMQNPVGAEFNYETMRMELTDFWAVFFNPIAQVKFVHTVSASYVTGAMFMLSVSAWYLLKRRHLPIAKRSMTVAASFGLASALSVVVLGDESGYVTTEHQKVKLAAFEAMWETEEPPASFTVVGIPDMEQQKTHFAIKIPWVFGIIATRSLDEEVLGIRDLIERAQKRIRRGIKGYEALQRLRTNPSDTSARDVFERYKDDVGYAFLLRRHTEKVTDATEEQIQAAARGIVPRVFPLFYAFRIMVACGFFFIVLFAYAFYLSARHWLDRYRWFLWVALWSLPLPWVAAECGWFIAEYGRQPWIIEHTLPTFLGVSSVSAAQVWFSLAGFVLFYSVLAVVDVFLMIKYIRIGPKEESPEPAGGLAWSGLAPAMPRKED